MKRFIQHDGLARDSRFVRQDNVLGNVLAAPSAEPRPRLRRLRYAEKTGDEVMDQAVDSVLANELPRVRFGAS